jgi:hypothetical protein
MTPKTMPISSYNRRMIDKKTGWTDEGSMGGKSKPV